MYTVMLYDIETKTRKTICSVNSLTEAMEITNEFWPLAYYVKE